MTARPISQRLRRRVLRRDRWCCVRCGRSIVGQQYSLQHRQPRQMGGRKDAHTFENLITLCGSATSPGCHRDVETHRTEALQQGYLVSSFDDPADIPVLVWGRWWSPVGDQWEPVEPDGGQAA